MRKTTRKIFLGVLTVLLLLPGAGFAGDVEVCHVWLKWEMRGLDAYRFEAEVQVKNYGETSYRVYGRLSFYDRYGFPIKSKSFSGKVGPGENSMFIAKGSLSTTERNTVDSYQATIRSEYPTRR